MRALPGFGVAMCHVVGVTALLQSFAHVFGNHNAAVLATGAAKGNGEIAFAFLGVVGEQESEQVFGAGEEFFGLGKERM